MKDTENDIFKKKEDMTLKEESEGPFGGKSKEKAPREMETQVDKNAMEVDINDNFEISLGVKRSGAPLVEQGVENERIGGAVASVDGKKQFDPYDDVHSNEREENERSSQEGKNGPFGSQETKEDTGSSHCDSKTNSSNLHENATPPLKPNPLDQWIGKLFFFTFEWMTPMVLKGIFKPVKMEDVWDMRRGSKSEVMLKNLKRAWDKRSHKRFALIRALVVVFGWRMCLSGLFKLLLDSFQMAGPLLLSYIITNITDTTQASWIGYALVSGLLACQIGMVICSNFFQYHSFILRVHLRSTLMAMVYDKSMWLSTESRSTRTVGEMVNFMSLDSQKIADTAQFFHMLWSGIYQIIVCLIVLLTLIGWPALVGMSVMVATIPIQLITTRLMAKFRIKSMVFTDQRIRSINEILQGIRIIKFFSWESSYKKRIAHYRRREVFEHIKMALSRSVMIGVMLGSPTIVSVSTFTTYVLVGYELKAKFVFSSLAYFNLLRFPLMSMSNVLQFVLESIVSLQRLEDFFRSEENVPRKAGTNFDMPIVIENGHLEWPEKKTEKSGKKKKMKKRGKIMAQYNVDKPRQVGQLVDINLSVPRGSLTMVIGSIGSGKSSLLSALTGEMCHLGGKLELSGSIAYCPQQAWLQTNTLRDNILFGSEYDPAKYDEVIQVCELSKDLTILPNGDQTEIGEKGLNLSGGQKQRVSIARAVYADADVYLLDDVLSALDQHVGRAVFDKCIRQKLHDKTRLLVSHQLQYVQYADHVIVMENGCIAEKGSFDELMRIEGGLLRGLIEEHVNTDHDEDGEEEKVASSEMTTEVEIKQTQKTMTDSKSPPPLLPQEDAEKNNIILTQEEKDTLQTERTKKGKLITQEGRAKGGISFYVFWRYAVYMGGPIMILLCELTFMIAQLGIVAGDWWMSMWTSNTFPHLDIGQNLGIYAGIGAFGAVGAFSRTALFYALALLASYRMHGSMLTRTIHATMLFFDTTPVGRILNRFSKDCEMADTMVPIFLVQVIGISHQLVISCGLIIYATWYYVFVLIPVFIVYWIIQHLYRKTSRELKRHEAVRRSPVFSHFGESLSGIPLIRAFDKSKSFVDMNRLLVDTNMRPFYAQLMSMRWLGVRLESLGAGLVGTAALFTLFAKGSPDLQPGVIGLALTYSLQLTQFMQFFVTQLTEAETAMNSVERIVEYTNGNILTQEKLKDKTYVHKPENWPNHGGVVFKDYVMRYRPDLDPVLRGITLDVKAGEHIGIVGRTGAGKSSIMLALYRMVEASEGSIEIDGIDIANLRLTDLRTSLSIIPQDPTLFSGTVRSNLDPFNEYEDKEIWQCLESSHMKETVMKLEHGLDSRVAEGGENFSLGERQLFCLARSLIRESKILILDEATASIDMETDRLIQETIREGFAGRTTLTIAHRLNTIVDSDRILVLDHGLVKEFDTPANLVKRPDTLFNALIAETGPANARSLRKQALGTELSTYEMNADTITDAVIPTSNSHEENVLVEANIGTVATPLDNHKESEECNGNDSPNLTSSGKQESEEQEQEMEQEQEQEKEMEQEQEQEQELQQEQEMDMEKEQEQEQEQEHEKEQKQEQEQEQEME